MKDEEKRKIAELHKMEEERIKKEINEMENRYNSETPYNNKKYSRQMTSESLTNHQRAPQTDNVNYSFEYQNNTEKSSIKKNEVPINNDSTPSNKSKNDEKISLPSIVKSPNISNSNGNGNETDILKVFYIIF